MMNLEINTAWGRDDDIALALSGGIDSMVLYSLLTREYKHTYKTLTVIHVNHNVREASEEEAAYIKNMTKRDCIRFEMTVLDFTDGFSQEAGRVKRYEFFESVLKKLDIKYLLMGHHQDDQYETVLQQLLTGRHLYGNLGIPEVRDTGSYTVVRPFKTITKQDIQKYQRHHDITYFEDRSNSEDGYTRNYVRHHIIPAVKESASLDISQLDNVRQDLNELSDFAYRAAEDFVKRHDSRLPRAGYLKHSGIIRRYILTVLLNRQGVRISRQSQDSLDELLESGPPQTVFEAGAVSVHIEYDYFYAAPSAEGIPETLLSVEDNGEFIYNDYHVTVNLCKSELPLTLRMKADGDKVHIKNTGTKKISRLFIDKKIPAGERLKMPVVVNSDGIIIAVGTIYNIIEPSENRLLKITKEFNDDNSK
ncbi:tRNA(Ile)-lysidine synthase [Jeotgalicoccus coquinae]|uniref:tRNA(Ile)-lysidine synthase n=1 Tax=Jeotgalicoccus coquinae TaxID=709509 RepID=A0A6V7RRB7_9STAP|nr:tRNA lysidine(34) synthetase TilS [Jeotgalicoccus coquinae]MBB6423834.1 tRNA(Ile)-lysidine synthase [Jeotgalicoccus coquinae]GGE24621.1 tRNA(Ile)-lysidine synthase [Jeotgalicoccus coquinae]CAD2080801.1 tRNA(Ile)-lysidine synthase [Jeotgalicoccus coquinae]